MTDTHPKTPLNRQNCFGLLRLIFASLVVVSHTPELIDGNRGREILTRLFGTISFGEFAVDCFFLVSGYLITASVISKRSLTRYFVARVARIYPAFLASFVFCVAVVAPLSGASFGAVVAALPASLAKMVLLLPPNVTGTFDGTHYAALNGAVWTISYEFVCYILAAVLLKAGVLRRPGLIAAIAATTLTIFIALQVLVLPGLAEQTFRTFALIHAARSFRLGGIFLVGAAYYVWRSAIRYRGTGAVFAAVLLVASLSSGLTAEPGLAVFGGYLIFYIADAEFMKPWRHINNDNDVSYGVYLYSWPLEKLLLWYLPGIGAIPAAALTLAAAVIFGSASWFLLEKPVLTRVRRLV